MELTKKINNTIDKIPIIAGLFMLLVSIIFSSAYSSQDMAILVFMSTWGSKGASETFGWWFYFAGGLIYFAIFELIMRLIVFFVKMQIPILQKSIVYHYVRVTFCFNYLILGAFHLVYFFFPLLQTLGIVVDFFISSIFLYMVYHLVSRKMLPDFLWARTLKATASIFFIYQGLNVLMSIIGMFGGL